MIRRGAAMAAAFVLCAALCADLRAQIQWLKVYSLSPYAEFWNLTAEVASLEDGLPALLKIFSDAGGSLTQPLGNFPSSPSDGVQQLSFRMTAKSASKALQKLKKVASYPPPSRQPNPELAPLSEVKEKIRRLSAEKKAFEREAAEMPASSALADELLSHLMTVEAVREKAQDQILVNVTLRETR
ncbi:MAG: hypothetical protein HY921_06540 [Elusimicrobia bacterium]|nr:hypothetical protein [Elusimicrobiota bacterium]